MYHMTLVELSCLCLSTSAPFQNSNEKMTNSGHAVVVWEYESRGGKFILLIILVLELFLTFDDCINGLC